MKHHGGLVAHGAEAIVSNVFYIYIKYILTEKSNFDLKSFKKSGFVQYIHAFSNIKLVIYDLQNLVTVATYLPVIYMHVSAYTHILLIRRTNPFTDLKLEGNFKMLSLNMLWYLSVQITLQ